MSKLLGDIVRSAVASAVDIKLCSETAPHSDLSELLDDVPADVVVVGCKRRELPGLEQVFFAHRRPVALIALTDDGRSSYLCRLAPETSELGPPSRSCLVRTIRQAMEWPRTPPVAGCREGP